jgi:hypothetical protein
MGLHKTLSSRLSSGSATGAEEIRNASLAVKPLGETQQVLTWLSFSWALRLALSNLLCFLPSVFTFVFNLSKNRATVYGKTGTLQSWRMSLF